MINTLSIFHELEETLDSRAAEKITDVIWRVYDELQNTVTKDEFRELRQIVQELSEAQHRTEQRVEELAEAQKRTEQALQRLTRRVDDVDKRLGGLSDSVGYGLEDKAYPALPRLLQRDFGIEVKEPLYRRFVLDKSGQQIEVNIFGNALREGKPVQILGESKSQLSKKNITAFIRKTWKRLEQVYPNIFPILITYMSSEPDVQQFAEEQGIHIYYSYQFAAEYSV